MSNALRRSTPALPIDWPLLVTRLKRNLRCGNRKLAERAGCDEALIGRLERAEIREPRFTTGLLLLNEHLAHASVEEHRALLTGTRL